MQFYRIFCNLSYIYIISQKFTIIIHMKIHIDIDCFFVSAARILEPKLEYKPVAIGGRSDTKNYHTV